MGRLKSEATQSSSLELERSLCSSAASWPCPDDAALTVLCCYLNAAATTIPRLPALAEEGIPTYYDLLRPNFFYEQKRWDQDHDPGRARGAYGSQGDRNFINLEP